MNNSNSLISVILPVYNCQEYIFDAVQSILNQTYTNFELLIIDDCSTDETVKVIKSFNDERINLILKEKNSGYTDSLNYGITISKGDFIARMDGDDISFPERFQKQIDFLQANEDIILCGTGIKIIDSTQFLRHPSSHEDIKVKLCFSNAFYHPTVMFKSKTLEENNYDKNFEPAEDYDLWTKLVFKGKVANLNEILLNYRIHPNQISNYKKEIQLEAATISQMRMFQILLVNETINIEHFKVAFKFTQTNKKEDLINTFQLFNKIKKKNKVLKIYNEPNFEKSLKNVRINFLRNFIKSGFSIKHLSIYMNYFTFYDIASLLNITKRLKSIL